MRTDTRGFYTAEWQVNLAPEGRLIDVGYAYVDAVDELKNCFDIARVDRSRQTVLHRVGGLEGSLGVGHTDDREHRTKNLFTGHAHRGLHTIEHGWREPVTARQTAQLR